MGGRDVAGSDLDEVVARVTRTLRRHRDVSHIAAETLPLLPE
jgi:hypothetical protein